MKSKIFGVREKVLSIITLTMIEIFCIVISIILTIGVNDFTNLIDLDNGSTNFLICEIVSLVFTIISLVIAFISLAFKDKETKNKLLCVNIVIFLFLNVISFICIFIAPIVIISSFIIFICGICNVVLQILCSNINIQNQSFKETTDNLEELTIKEEIEKLKARVRIKDLEKEYMDLKTKLDS